MGVVRIDELRATKQYTEFYNHENLNLNKDKWTNIKVKTTWKSYTKAWLKLLSENKK